MTRLNVKQFSLSFAFLCQLPDLKQLKLSCCKKKKTKLKPEHGKMVALEGTFSSFNRQNKVLLSDCINVVPAQTDVCSAERLFEPELGS